MIRVIGRNPRRPAGAEMAMPGKSSLAAARGRSSKEYWKRSSLNLDTDATPSVFAARVVREATRRGFDRAARQAVLGDGATVEAGWRRAGRSLAGPRRRRSALCPSRSAHRSYPRTVAVTSTFPMRFRSSTASTPSSTSRTCPSPLSPSGDGLLADLFLGRPRSRRYPQIQHPAGHPPVVPDLAQQWASERHDELDAGDIDDILDALRVHSPKDEEARKCIGYVERNAASACATRSSGQQGFVPRLGSLRPAAR